MGYDTVYELIELLSFQKPVQRILFVAVLQMVLWVCHSVPPGFQHFLVIFCNQNNWFCGGVFSHICKEFCNVFHFSLHLILFHNTSTLCNMQSCHWQNDQCICVLGAFSFHKAMLRCEPLWNDGGDTLKCLFPPTSTSVASIEIVWLKTPLCGMQAGLGDFKEGGRWWGGDGRRGCGWAEGSLTCHTPGIRQRRWPHSERAHVLTNWFPGVKLTGGPRGRKLCNTLVLRRRHTDH